MIISSRPLDLGQRGEGVSDNPSTLMASLPLLWFMCMGAYIDNLQVVLAEPSWYCLLYVKACICKKHAVFTVSPWKSSKSKCSKDGVPCVQGVTVGGRR